MHASVIQKMTSSSDSFSVRYGGNIRQMFWTCFSSATLVVMFVVLLLLLVEGFEWTLEKCVLCVSSSAFYMILKTTGVLVKIFINHMSFYESSHTLCQILKIPALSDVDIIFIFVVYICLHTPKSEKPPFIHIYALNWIVQTKPQVTETWELVSRSESPIQIRQERPRDPYLKNRQSKCTSCIIVLYPFSF